MEFVPFLEFADAPWLNYFFHILLRAVNTLLSIKYFYLMKKKEKFLDFSRIGENISSLMTHCAIDATELARETGLPTSTISRLRSNVTEFSPNISSLLPIARYFQITVSQLIGEEALPQDICGTFKPSFVKKQLIPLIEAKNIYDYFISNHLIESSFIETDLLVSNKAFACYVQGSAMEPTFLDKSLLIVEPGIVTENLDYVLAVSTQKKLLFRQLLTDGEERYLKPLNPFFTDFININKEQFQIIGPIVQLRKNFKNIEHTIHEETAL